MKKEKEPVPEIDESLLTERQKAEMQRKQFSWKYLLFPCIVLALMAVCVIVIVVLRKK